MALSLEVSQPEKWHTTTSRCVQTEITSSIAWTTVASAKIPHFFRQLSDESLSTADRARAAMFLVHMVGDIHQPLHVRQGR